MDNAPQSSTSASLSVDATMQEVKTRDPRLSNTQAEAAAATYFAKVCGTNIEKEYDSLGEVFCGWRKISLFLPIDVIP